MTTTICWTIYNRPRDFPDAFVARKFLIDGVLEPVPTPEVITAATFEELHTLVRADMARTGIAPLFFPRQPHDEPQIIGCWI